MVSYLQRYATRLFGHPAIRDEDGNVLAVVARTNNAAEHLFGGQKQQLRRRLGRAHLARDLQQQPAQALVVTNLRHPDYVRVVCGSLDHLPAALAAVAALTVDGTTPLTRDHRDHRLHRCIKGLLQGSATAETHDINDDHRHGSIAPTPPDLSPPLPLIREFTAQQLRARCANVFAPERDPRLPPPGGVLRRTWKGVEHEVRVLDRGFEYRGQPYLSLAAVATAITDGDSTMGVAFFNLQSLAETRKKPRPPRPTYPLGQSAERIRQDLLKAGYMRSTSELYAKHIQRFANHYMRPLQDMGETEILTYLVHLLDGYQERVGPYRSARSALLTVYRVSLRRPQEIENIPTRPADVRKVAAILCPQPPGSAPAGSVSRPSREELQALLGEPTDPLSQSVKRIRAALVEAGYQNVSTRTYIGHIRRFVRHYGRPAEAMGEREVVGYLLHLLEDGNTGLATYIGVRSALNAVCRGSLGRLNVVERITRRPEDLRNLAASLGIGRDAAGPPADSAQNAA